MDKEKENRSARRDRVPKPKPISIPSSIHLVLYKIEVQEGIV